MSIATIVKDAKDKVAEFGGVEQCIGGTTELAETCGVDEDGILFFVAELGEALESEGLKLVTKRSKLFVAKQDV